MILASNSPRRYEILKELGFNLKVISANIDETSEKEDIIEKILDIALKKSKSIAKSNTNEFVVAADTIVEINGEILGKPKDKAEAYTFLKKLSGKTHRVITAFSLINLQKNICIKNYQTSLVKFYELDDSLIDYYLNTKEPYDKAGAYGIQGFGRIFIEKIEGDYFSIMGFPASKFIQELLKLGYNINDFYKL